jgi:hypothetical protein
MTYSDANLMQRLCSPALDANSHDLKYETRALVFQGACLALTWAVYGLLAGLAGPGHDIALYTALGITALLAGEMPRTFHQQRRLRHDRTRMEAMMKPARRGIRMG